ncbi:unnamed protein product [Phytophthora fragariaefolia]|uniref:Unnamed protein product n=1 Tax=Phytophthora fragariaefolia TaxID=1490495 RepID=A0A9W6Y6P4_9STRA|nr:unnamed protein product [Phytophthora fragariaefolia]
MRPKMRPQRFTDSPFGELELTMGDRSQLEALAQTFVSDNLRQYVAHAAIGLDQVDDRRWKVVRTKEALRVYTERSKRDMARRARKQQAASATENEAGYTVSELPVMFSAGTLVGQLDDVMFGAVNPSLEHMQIKASYVRDVSGAAVLATVAEPTLDDPFCSLTIKWMEVDLPLCKSGLVKNRDYVYMEATGTVQLGHQGERIGYHLMHSVHFPQTVDRPHKVRGRLSICSFFRQTNPDTVEHYSSGTIDPGGVIPRSLLVRSTATQMLAPLRYAYCGQMKKLTWMLQQKREERRIASGSVKMFDACVTCRSKASNLFSSTCCMCLGDLCRSCSIKKHLSFLSPDRTLMRSKVYVCAACMIEGLQVSASRAARDQLFDASASTAFATCSVSVTSSDFSDSPIALSRSRYMCPIATV